MCEDISWLNIECCFGMKNTGVIVIGSLPTPALSMFFFFGWLQGGLWSQGQEAGKRQQIGEMWGG